jgi:membrane associated rhomboid family serine protease
MTFCEHCGEPINYLPFKCKYCGGVYCKKHRLPENHQCTFELKHGPIVPLNLRESPSKSVSSHGTSREFKKYIKRQEKQRTIKHYETTTTKTNSTTYLIIAIFIMSIASMGYPLYLTLSSYSFLELYLWTFITSLFVSYTSDFFGLFFLFILIIFFYMIIKNIERVFGTKFLLQLYFVCAVFTGLVYILLLLLLQLIYIPYGSVIVVPYGLASGALLGVICFMIFMNWDREMTFLIFFLPIRMRGKTIITFLVLLKVVPGLLLAMGNPIYLLVYLPDLGGILASYIVHYYKFKHR